MISRLEEMQLIARCIAFDDHRAFARLVDEYSPTLRRFIFNMTLGNASLTDDLAQNTFIKAYTSIKSFRGLSRFSTWLYTIACREYADWCRRSSEIPVNELPSSCDRAAETAKSIEISHDLSAAMQCLNEHERAAVLLFYFEDRPLKEIVKITGRPEGTVKATLSRARTKLAQFLK